MLSSQKYLSHFWNTFWPSVSNSTSPLEWRLSFSQSWLLCYTTAAHHLGLASWLASSVHTYLLNVSLYWLKPVHCRHAELVSELSCTARIGFVVLFWLELSCYESRMSSAFRMFQDVFIHSLGPVMSIKKEVRKQKS